jgi:serine/threonine-protein kinase
MHFSIFIDGEYPTALSKWKELTKPEEMHRWVQEEQVEQDMVDSWSWEDHEGKRWPFEKTPSSEFVDVFLASSACVELQFKNMHRFVQWTREEFKSAWFLDKNKNKQNIYFKFRNVCGEGAVKRTYFGWDVVRSKPVVVYQINIPVNHTEQKRCLNEKRIAEVEKSPYLLTIHFSYMHRDTRKVYMIADYCPYNVKQMIEDPGVQWTMNDLRTFATHILNGLKVLHDMNVIHRDIKPSNIVFDDTLNVYKLIDFGIATKFSSESNLHKIETLSQNTESDHLGLVGTPGYISPEMFDCMHSLKKNTYNCSVDVFSFGITLLEMYLRDRAFRKDFEDLPHRIREDVSARESLFNNMLDEVVPFLRQLYKRLDDFINTRRMETLRSEIQEKIGIIHQMNTCDDCDEKEVFMSELIEKNKSISYFCKKIPDQLHDLDEKASTEYEFISQMKTLKYFSRRLDNLVRIGLDDLVDDVQVYPVLFMTSSYHFPKAVNSILEKEPLLGDFLRRCVDKNPLHRSSVQELLHHPWIVGEKQN